MANQHLRIRRDGPIEHVELNRPEVRNAFNPTLIAELRDWAAAVAGDRDVRVAVLSGAGRVFCAGADLNAMTATISASRAENVDDARRLAAMFGALDTLPIPLVGRVHGAAMGGGTGLAAVCDIVIAEVATIFAFTEVRIGLVPSVISPFVLEKIGRSAARDLFLTGRRFSAARAREIGLVHEVVAAEALDEAVQRITHEILASGPDSVRGAKRLIRDLPRLTPAEATAMTVETIASCRVSAEGQEGMRAFLEKRPPRWTR